MAAISREIVIDVPIERFFDLVIDYPSYPEFVPGIHGCRVKAAGVGGKEVEYELDVGVKKIRYLLRHVEERPRRVVWSLVSGEWMKVSSGSWELEDAGGKTRARYTVDIQIAKPALVPQAIVDRVADELTRVQLPRTLDAFKRRAESR
ncbi:MAG TPA: SRPBCC family protein [Anaeromyxobacter sp.]|nr:SRPBCC family protein [Anaeromyxobacter sp.]